jgi:dTDP-3-amino-3,4,6-trideoxy-alpha-D-glucopyranose N,N-dimethyltransferase
VACGTGKHLAELRASYDAEGIDSDPDMLAVARERLDDVPLHEADMTDFALTRRFDVVTCLFSSIAYTLTQERLRQAVASMARHLNDGGLLLVEPWILPEHLRQGGLHAIFVDEPELKIARVNHPPSPGQENKIEFHFLVGTSDGIDHFTETHRLGSFTDADYRDAFERAGLVVEHDQAGISGRGLYIGKIT